MLTPASSNATLVGGELNLDGAALLSPCVIENRHIENQARGDALEMISRHLRVHV